MDINAIQELLQYYQLSVGMLIGSVVLALVIIVLIFSLFSLLGAKIVKASRPTFGPAILMVLSYLGLTIILSFIFQILPANILYSQSFEIVNFVINFVLYSWLASRFFRTTFVKGLGIAFITFVLFFVLVFVLALLTAY